MTAALIAFTNTDFTAAPASPNARAFWREFVAALAMSFSRMFAGLRTILGFCTNHQMPWIHTTSVPTNPVIKAHIGRDFLSEHFVGNSMGIRGSARSICVAPGCKTAITIVKPGHPDPAFIRVNNINFVPKSWKMRLWVRRPHGAYHGTY